jgi:hypothetical protein
MRDAGWDYRGWGYGGWFGPAWFAPAPVVVVGVTHRFPHFHKFRHIPKAHSFRHAHKFHPGLKVHHFGHGLVRSHPNAAIRTGGGVRFHAIRGGGRMR